MLVGVARVRGVVPQQGLARRCCKTLIDLEVSRPTTRSVKHAVLSRLHPLCYGPLGVRADLFPPYNQVQCVRVFCFTNCLSAGVFYLNLYSGTWNVKNSLNALTEVASEANLGLTVDDPLKIVDVR